MKQLISPWHVFWQLFKTDMVVFKETLWEKLIDSMIWVSANAIIKCYIMTGFGLSSDFGPMFAAGLIVSAGGFELYGGLANLIGDMEGEGHINYQLTLPLPGWMVWLKTALVCSVRALFIGFVAMVVCKILLWNTWSWATLDPFKVALMFVLGRLYTGAYFLFLASFTPSLMRLETTFMRIVFPLWFFGGFEFSWMVLHKLYPKLSYISIINPEMHGMESMRTAFLGQKDFFPFWISVPAIMMITVVFGLVGMRRLKRRLDHV